MSSAPSAGEAVAQHGDARGLVARMNVVGGELADGPLLLDVGEADLLAGDRLGEVVRGALLALGALEERLREQRRGIVLVGIGDRARLPFARRQQRDIAPRAALDLEMVPRLVRHVEGDGLAGERVAIPVGKLEVVEAADQAGAVVDAGPRRLADAVRALPPPALQVVGIVNLDLADGRVRRREAARECRPGRFQP